MNDFIYVLTVDEKPVGILSNDNPGACPYTDDSWFEKKEDALIAYEFTIPMLHETAKDVTEEGYIIRYSPAGVLTLLQIISIEEDNTKDAPTKRVYCENSGLELLGNYTPPANYTGQTLGQAAGNLLAGTRWEIGANEFTTQVTTNIENYETVLAAILQVAKDTGAEIQFRVEMNGLMVERRLIDFLVRRGRDTKKRFQYGKNIDGLTRKADRSTVATAVIPLGKGGSGGDQLTIKNVVWSTASGDPVDKPAGLEYVADEDARQKWGNGGYHIFKVLETELEDPAKLIKAGWDHLQIVKEASFTYEMKVVLLQQLAGYEYEIANIGDTVSVYDPTFIPAVTIEGRIAEMEVSFTDPEKSTVKLSNYVVAKSNITQALRNIQTMLYKNENVWSSGGTTITAQDTPPADPKIDDYWLDTSKSPIKVLKWFDGADWEKATPEMADEIAETAGRKWAGQSGADVTAINDSRDTANVGGKPSDQVRDDSNAGKDAKDKIDTEVGSGTIETVAGATQRADEARQQAIIYTNDYAEQTVYIRDLPPDNPAEGTKWIDTSDAVIDVWKVYRSGAWAELGRTNLAQMGGAVQAGQIANGAVTHDKIYAGSITTDLFSSVGISAEVIKFGAMSGDRILANTIDANKLRAGTVIADDIIFKGKLEGASGLFSGSVSVGNTFQNGLISLSDGLFTNVYERMISTNEELRVSTEVSTGGIAFKRRVYNAQYGTETLKTTRMEQTANYLEVAGDMFVTGDFIVNQMALRWNGVSMTPRGGIYFGEDPSGGGGDFMVERYTSLLAGTRFGSGYNVTADGPLYVNNNMYLRYAPIATGVERGYCGLQIEAGSTTYTNGIGYGVNYKHEKNYVPSSISISRDSGNLANSGVYTGYITQYGFWFQILRADLVGTNTAWRGTYYA